MFKNIAALSIFLCSTIGGMNTNSLKFHTYQLEVIKKSTKMDEELKQFDAIRLNAYLSGSLKLEGFSLILGGSEIAYDTVISCVKKYHELKKEELIISQAHYEYVTSSNKYLDSIESIKSHLIKTQNEIDRSFNLLKHFKCPQSSLGQRAAENFFSKKRLF